MMWSYLREHLIRRAAAFCTLIEAFSKHTSAHYTTERIAVVKLGGYRQNWNKEAKT